MNNVQKVWFFIHRLSAEKIVKISLKLFKKYPFVKPTIEGDKCILLCYDISGSAASWLCNKAIDLKKFRGRFASDHPLYDADLENRTVHRYFMAACRYGYFDFWDYPLDDFLNFLKRRFDYQFHKKMPLYEASKLAAIETNHALHPNPAISLFKKKEYIGDLIKFFGKSQSEAEALVLECFPELKDIKIEKKAVNENEEREKRENFNKKIHDLVGKLAFMSPKMRKCYLKENDNIEDFLLFMVIVRARGFDWVKSNIGVIPGIID